MLRPAWSICAATLCLCWAAGPAGAADAPQGAEAGTAKFFESKIRPVLVARCHECHASEAKSEGNLRVDSLAALVRGGDRGPALKPGDVKGSLLIDAIRHGEVVQMPPKTKLPAAEIADLTAWVAAGAPWPDAAPITTTQPAAAALAPLSAEARNFWAFQPPAEPAVPDVKNGSWPKSTLDRFVLSPLEARGLSPAPPADKRTLIRRATFDLHGLPPSPAEIDAFLADDTPEAFARVVDRLLASPRYGERWGRHWLDIARYADSNGMDENMAMAQAWRYRDYVVGAFNKDTPYDQFIREQLAGDLLESRDDATRFERLTATGFLVLGPKMLAEDDPVKMEMDIIDEQVDTIGRAFLGLTLGCARCHDHKFDPIPTADYYSLAGIFKSTKTMANHSVVAMWSERPLASAAVVAQLEAHEKEIAATSKEIDAVQTAARDKMLDLARGQLAQYLLAATHRVREQQALTTLAGELAAGKLGDGAIVVEAENFDRGNVVRDAQTYGQGIGVIYNAGPLPNFAEYDVVLPAAGTYQIALRYAAAESRPLELSLDGRKLSDSAAGATTGSWQPDTQTWSIEAVVPLAAGRHVLRLERSEPLPHVDKVALVPARFTRDPRTGASRTVGQPRDESTLNATFLRQWVAFLDSTQDDVNSVLHVWHLWRQADDRAAAPPADPAGPVAAALLAAPRPTNLSELASRYQQLCQQAHAALRQQNASDKSPAPVADATHEAFRPLFADTSGPFAIGKNKKKKNFDDEYPAETQASLTKLRERLAELEKSKPQIDNALAVAERKPEDLHIHIRGSHLTQGELAPRRFPRVLAGEEQRPIGQQASGRRELAEWLARADNPLTSRVMINRIWQGHFGEGLVRSPDNFGKLGELPDNQPLLDWLARRFVESGWSIKAMHRLIMLSSAYQMSTAPNEQAAAIDPENRLLWRMNRRRLEAEEIRDGILAASGSVDWSMGGTLLANANHTYVTSTASANNVNYENIRRSVYLPVVRSAIYDVFQAFDFADPSTMNGKRPSTTVAPQALFMMNSTLVERQTRAMAEKLLGRPGLDDAARVSEIYVRIYGRPASAVEVARATDFMARYEADLTGHKLEAAEARVRAWQALCRVAFSANEFIFLQ